MVLCASHLLLYICIFVEPVTLQTVFFSSSFLYFSVWLGKLARYWHANALKELISIPPSQAKLSPNASV